MTYTVVRVPVQLSKETDALSFGLRAAIADHIRWIFRNKFDAAVTGGLSKQDVAQRFGLQWQQARAAYKNVRDIPASLLNWCGHVEFHSGEGDFPAAEPLTVGTFNKDTLTVLPAGVVMVRIAGLYATGLAPEDQPIRLHEVREIRLRRIEEAPAGHPGYEAVIVQGHDEAPREDAAAPQPFETEDA